MAMLIAGVYASDWLAGIAADGGGTIDVPVGVSTGFFDLAASNVWFRGKGSRASILRFQSGGGAEDYIVRSTGTWRRQIRFTDIGFDGASIAARGLTVQGYAADDFLFERCQFTNFIGHAFLGHELQKCRFVQCEFLSPGDITGVGVQFGSGVYNTEFVDCRFGWGRNGIVVDSGSNGEIPSGRIVVRGGSMRQDYWAMKAYNDPNATGSGGTVTYSGSGDIVLTDTAKDFTAIPYDPYRTIRLMPVATTGNTTNVGNTYLRDSTKDFRTMGLAYGDIVRTATAWSMVVGTNPAVAGEVFIDGWRDLSTYDDVAPPTSGTAYTVYQVILGETSLVTPTTITGQIRWRKLTGVTVSSIPDGTRYEILGNRASDGILSEDGATNFLLDGMKFHGCWSDQWAISGANSIVTNVTSVYGQDGGGTLRGRGSRASNCVFIGNGGANLFLPLVEGAEVDHCTFVDGATEYIVADVNADVALFDAVECAVHDNRIERINNPRGLYGIAQRAASVNNVIRGNTIKGHINGPFLTEPTVVGSRIYDNDVS